MTAWVMVVLAANVVDGGLVVSDVEDVLALNAAEFASCLKTKKPVPVAFEVGSNGAVSGVTAKDDCVRAAVAKLAFPSAGDTGTYVSWNVTRTSTRDAGVDGEPTRLDASALAPFDAEATNCYAAIKPTEKDEGSVSLDFVLLRSGAVHSVALAEQSPKFMKTSLAACLQAAARPWRLPSVKEVRTVRGGWVFATSERRVRMHYVPSEPRREIVTAATPIPEGGLLKSVIMDVINAHRNHVRACYELELLDQPKLHGKVAIAWTIGSDGSVVEASVNEDSTGSKALVECIVTRVRSWRFPPPDGGGVVNVTFPWLFNAAGVVYEE